MDIKICQTAIQTFINIKINHSLTNRSQVVNNLHSVHLMKDSVTVVQQVDYLLPVILIVVHPVEPSSHGVPQDPVRVLLRLELYTVL